MCVTAASHAAHRIGVRAPATRELEQDRGAVLGHDRALELRDPGARGCEPRAVRAAEAARHAPLDASLGQEQDVVAGAIGLAVAEREAVERLRRSSLEQALDVLGEDVDLDVHLVARAERAERRHRARVRDERDRERVVGERRRSSG